VEDAEIFLNIFKKCDHSSKFKFFRIFDFFPACFCCFLPADTADKRHVELQIFS